MAVWRRMKTARSEKGVTVVKKVSQRLAEDKEAHRVFVIPEESVRA